MNFDSLSDYILKLKKAKYLFLNQVFAGGG